MIDAPRPELYDLARDPFEQRNLYEAHTALAGALTRRARSLAAGGASGYRPGDRQGDVPVGLRARLAALGYVGAAPARASADLLDGRGALPDPKDCIGIYNRRQNSGGANAVETPARCR